MSWTVISQNYIASTGDQLLVETTVDIVEIKLPESPSVGDSVSIADNGSFSTNSCLVDPNGLTIEGSPNNIYLAKEKSQYLFVFNGSTWKKYDTSLPRVKVTELRELSSVGITDDDFIVVLDSENNETKKARISNVKSAINAEAYTSGEDVVEYLNSRIESLNTPYLNVLRFDGRDSSYYLNYDNLENTPTIPTTTSELINDGSPSSSGTPYVTDLTSFTTDDLAEGDVNLYFTESKFLEYFEPNFAASFSLYSSNFSEIAVFDNRAEAVTAIATESYLLTDKTVIFDGLVWYKLVSGADQIDDMPGWFPASESVSFHHFGAVGDGVTDDTAAIQKTIDFFAGTSITDALEDSGFKGIDGLAKVYKLTSPIYLGRFDLDQDGTFEEDHGYFYGLNIENCKFLADDTVVWTNSLGDEIEKFLFLVGSVQTTSSQEIGDQSGDMFYVMNTKFTNVEFDCNFKTGGVHVENTYRTKFSNCLFVNFGIGGQGVSTSWQNPNDNPRGIFAKNQETVVDNCRFEGNRRGDGFDDFPNKVAFQGGNEICNDQPTLVGSLTLDGAHTTAGEYISPNGDAMYVEIKNGYDVVNDFDDFSEANFTITGFEDLARTIPVSETMRGPVGGNKMRWSYSTKRYAVITDISCDTFVNNTAQNNISISSSYNTFGVAMRSSDFYITNCNFTACNRAMTLHAAAGHVQNNHPWSRQIDCYTKNIIFSGNYFDYTDVYLWDAFENIYEGNFTLGNANLITISTTAGETFSGLVVSGNRFGNDSFWDSRFIDGGSESIDSSLLDYTYVGNFVGTHADNYTHMSGAAFAKGYLTLGSGLRLGGNMFAANNEINAVRTLGLELSSSEPLGEDDGTIAVSTGAASTNGFGTAGAGLYIRLSGTWTKV